MSSIFRFLLVLVIIPMGIHYSAKSKFNYNYKQEIRSIETVIDHEANFSFLDVVEVLFDDIVSTSKVFLSAFHYFQIDFFFQIPLRSLDFFFISIPPPVLF